MTDEMVLSVDEVRLLLRRAAASRAWLTTVVPALFCARAQLYYNQKCLQQQKGRGPRGERLHGSGHFVRGDTSHILAVFTVDGFVDAHVTKDAFDADEFVLGFEDVVLPLVKPFPGRDSVIVIDNFSGHHADPSWIVEVYRRGGRVRFLPPYSPEFQPVETGIYHAKDWIQKHAAERAACADDEQFIHRALHSVVKEHAAMAFHTCLWRGERVYRKACRLKRNV